MEYRLLFVAVFALGYWLDSVSDKTLKCGGLAQLLWFCSMLGVVIYMGWFGIMWTRWAWGF